MYIRDRQQEAEVIKRSQEPRSYLLKTSDGTVFRRNRSAIVPTGYHDNHGEKQQMTELNTGERQNTPVIPPSPHKKTATPECRKKTPAAKPASPVKAPPSSLPATSKAPEKAASPPRQQTRTRVINPPIRFKDYVQ